MEEVGLGSSRIWVGRCGGGEGGGEVTEYSL